MQQALYGSYAVLWALVAVQTLVLLEVLRRVVRLKREIHESTPAVVKEERLAGGTIVDFEARELTNGGVVRTGDLRGRPSVLLFLSSDLFGPEDETPEWLLDTVVGLKARSEGHLYIVCEGEAGECSSLGRREGFDLPVLHDEDGEVRRRFLVPSTPAAVMLDEEARVIQYGRPERQIF
ncbi:MAG TPA: hypothetical protein VE685_02485 [Thermoanaerobaculia bacterium]|nr:hypothetical protein [Thermoanaerobaculia bacterium]